MSVADESLKRFIDEHERETFTVIFTNGDELDLELLHWFQDLGDEPKAHATVKGGFGKWETGSAIVYDLVDVREIREMKSETVFFRREDYAA